MSCTVKNVLLFFAAKRPIRKTKENMRKQKKTCFFLFLFCFLPVFLIGTLVQKYNCTYRNAFAFLRDNIYDHKVNVFIVN